MSVLLRLARQHCSEALHLFPKVRLLGVFFFFAAATYIRERLAVLKIRYLIYRSPNPTAFFCACLAVLHSSEWEVVLSSINDSSGEHPQTQRQEKNLFILLLLIDLSGESGELTDTVTKESSFPSLAANSSQLIQFPPEPSDSGHDCI